MIELFQSAYCCPICERLHAAGKDDKKCIKGFNKSGMIKWLFSEGGCWGTKSIGGGATDLELIVSTGVRLWSTYICRSEQLHTYPGTYLILLCGYARHYVPVCTYLRRYVPNLGSRASRPWRAARRQGLGYITTCMESRAPGNQ